MKITKHGDVMIFRCESCGCVFREAASKTDIANAAIWVPEKNTHGARLKCPDCGNDVIGTREPFTTHNVVSY